MASPVKRSIHPRPTDRPDLCDGRHPDHPVLGDPPPAGRAPAHVPHVAVEEGLPAPADETAVEEVGGTEFEIDLAEHCREIEREERDTSDSDVQLFSGKIVKRNRTYWIQ